MTPSASCAVHPERRAEGVCARCGTFICTGCTVSGDLCGPCRSRLHREGVAWTDEEKARAFARRSLRRSALAVRLLLGGATAGALTLVAAERGLVPEWFARGGWGLLVFALLAGIAATIGAVVGYRASNRGRPGPAVEGVVPLATALTIGVIGAAPLILGIVVALTR